MEACDRVELASAGIPGNEEVVCSCRKNNVAQARDGSCVMPPALALQQLEGSFLLGIENPALALPLAGKPAGKNRRRRQRNKSLQVRQSLLQLLDHLLDQKIAEGDAAEAFVGIRDGLEHRD